MNLFTRRKEGRSPQEGRPFKRRLRIILPVGCLLLMAAPLALNFLAMRVLQPPTVSLPKGNLSWQRDFGGRVASRETPVVAPVSPILGDFTLPQVLSVEDAMEWNGDWVLLDRRLGKIHILDSASGSIRSMGRDGPGPGELRDPVALALEDSTLWVLNQRGLVLDRYSLKEGFKDRRRVQGGGCLVGLAKTLSVIPGTGMFVLRICPATLPGPGTAWVEGINSLGELSPALSLPLGEPGSRRLHFLRQPAMVVGSESLFLGTWDNPCIGEFDPSGRIKGFRCLPAYRRPEVPAEEKSGLEKRFRRVTELGLLPIAMPDHLPWYDRVFSTYQGLVVRRVRGMEDRDLILLPPEGGSSVTGSLFPQNTFVGNETILSVQDLLQGTRVRIYPNPWR